MMNVFLLEAEQEMVIILNPFYAVSPGRLQI